MKVKLFSYYPKESYYDYCDSQPTDTLAPEVGDWVEMDDKEYEDLVKLVGAYNRSKTKTYVVIATADTVEEIAPNAKEWLKKEKERRARQEAAASKAAATRVLNKKKKQEEKDKKDFERLQKKFAAIKPAAL